MKTRVKIILMFLVFISNRFLCQENSIIQSLVVNYNTSEQIFGDTANNTIRGFPEATITLNNLSNVTKIYLKISKISDRSEIYNASYLIASAPVINVEGFTLFSKDGYTLRINGANLIQLEPYYFELLTEDSSGHLSNPYQAVH